jgi:hypothetical protein
MWQSGCVWLPKGVRLSREALRILVAVMALVGCDQPQSGGDAGASCPPDLTLCGTQCVDSQVDRGNCGGCGLQCDPGFVCAEGACALSCQTGLTECGGACRDLAIDPDHCGDCEIACADGFVCNGAGSCVAEASCDCPAGYACDGMGGCVLSCQLGFLNCNDTCVDPTTNRLYCGASGDCAGDNAGTICDPGFVCDGTGHCALSCQPELLDCTGTCTDPDTDRFHCGASYPCSDFPGEVCADGSVCNGLGQCELSCQQGLLDCEGTCIDPDADRNHCGASAGCLGINGGTACDANEICSSGVCLVPGVKEVTVGGVQVCAILQDGDKVRCWGYADNGPLGYGNEINIGDNEAPSSVGFVDIGGGATVAHLTAGGGFTCALLSTGAVRCWGNGYWGHTGQGNENHIGDDELPSSVPDVSVGATATQISAGMEHLCLRSTTSRARCWGWGFRGRLGYANQNSIGDNELPSAVGNVSVGTTVVEVAAGGAHTCARFSTGVVRCWGQGVYGALGYGNTESIGDDETPLSAGDVNVGGFVIGLAAGDNHTCALLDNGKVRCWGTPTSGPLGYAGGPEGPTPADAGDIDVGGTVTQITAGTSHTCALLDTGAIRCWGDGSVGALGYGNTNDIGDDETPASAGDIDIGGPAIQIDAGGGTTCAVRTDGALICWGNQGAKLGYGSVGPVGDDETPASMGPVPVF